MELNRIFASNWWKMTGEQQKLLTNFETRVRQLMLLCDALRNDKAELEMALKVKETELKEAQNVARDLATKYDNLKTAKTFAPADADVKSAQLRLSRLVREVDKCIALINE